MAVNLSPIWGAGAQLFDNSGNVLTGGKIYTYAAGTTTPATTYTSSNGITANSNPIILNSAGRVPYEIWLSDTVAYKFVLKDSNDTLIATYDNLVGINSNFIAYTAQQEIQTATAGQTVFNLTTMQYQPATNNLSVFVDGVNQYGPGAQYAYVETDSDTVTFVSGLHVGASVKFTTATPVAGAVMNAENVAYDPPFFGAVTTNVQDKLAETVSVKDFGAVGDGVTDDTQAIQDAFDSGMALYAPQGTYRLTAQIAISTSTAFSLVGDGSGISAFVWDSGSTDGGGFDITYTDLIYPPSISGISLKTKDDGVGTALKISGPDLTTNLGAKISDVLVIGDDSSANCWDIGIHLFICWYPVINNVSIKGKDESVLPFTMTTGILLESSQAALIQNFTIFHVTSGIKNALYASVFRDEGHIISSFEIVGVKYGIDLAYGAITAGTNIGPGHINAYERCLNLSGRFQTSIHDLLLYKTHLSTSDFYAIYMGNCDSCIIHDNQIHGNAAATGATNGILMTGSRADWVSNTIIHDNKFRNFYGSGKVCIIVGTLVNTGMIHNNSCDSTASQLIFIDASAEKDNIFYNNSPTDLQLLELNSTTPSVGNDLSGKWYFSNTNPTSVTNFDDGYKTQTITIINASSNTTLVASSLLILKGNANFAMNENDVITLQREDTLWREISRTEY